MRKLVVTSVGLLLVCVVAPTPALANGIDLVIREAKQGDQVPVTGHQWLTCCPPNTPVEHVQLFLIVENERVLLFDVSANERGEINTAFTVPYVTLGRYRLEACGGITVQDAPCLPEGRFNVLPGPPSPTLSPSGKASAAPSKLTHESSDGLGRLAVAAGLIVFVAGMAVASYIWFRRRASSN
jgi:hypothetical protein